MLNSNCGALAWGQNLTQLETTPVSIETHSLNIKLIRSVFDLLRQLTIDKRRKLIVTITYCIRQTSMVVVKDNKYLIPGEAYLTTSQNHPPNGGWFSVRQVIDFIQITYGVSTKMGVVDAVSTI